MRMQTLGLLIYFYVIHITLEVRYSIFFQMRSDRIYKKNYNKCIVKVKFLKNKILSKYKVTPSADAIIGKWKMDIDTKRRDSEGAVSFTVDNPFYVIFNPWCRGERYE